MNHWNNAQWGYANHNVHQNNENFFQGHHTQWGYANHNVPQSNGYGMRNEASNQFGYGLYYPNPNPILQNQNLPVSFENLDPRQTSNQPQWWHAGYPNEYNQFGPYDMHYNGMQQFAHGNYYAGIGVSNQPQPQDFQNSYVVQNLDNHQYKYSVPAVEDENMASDDRRETQSLLSGHSVPSELKGNIHQENRLVNYLSYLHESPMPADQIAECENNATDVGVNNSDVSLNIFSDVNVGEHDSNVTTGNGAIELNVNSTFEQETEHNENEINVLAESVVVKPKYKTGCDNSVMFVKTSCCKSAKKLCCPFCDKLFSKLAKHMEVKHETEPDVQRFLSFPKGSKQRRLIQDSLRKIGLTNWNTNAALNKNEMITSRRPNAKFGNDGPRFKTCPYCNGYYTRSSLRLHVAYDCPRKPIVNDKNTKGQRFVTALATSVEARYLESATPNLQKVYKKLRDDALVRSLKFDWLITVYGNKLAAKHTKLKSPAMIKGRLRLIARVLREVKRIEPEITDLKSLYHPKYFDRAIEAIQSVAKFDAENNEYGAPATASMCVTEIKKIGVMLTGEYIRKSDIENRSLTLDFLTLMDIDIHTMINKTVNENISKRRRRKVVNLPTLDDIKILNQYIQSESNDCYNDLSKSFDYKKWLYLSKLTMISILIYNRKRVGDTENITLDDFKFREAMNENTNQQLFASLSNESKEVARLYSRMKVCGKKDRTVPVLLNQSMEKSLILLISHREDSGVVPKNEYLFALPPSSIDQIRVINAGIALKKFVELSGAKNPSSINGTNLRKQLATMCVTLKLDDAEVADVADFMGHAELVHRNSYRQNTIDRQVVKMSQWLEAAIGNIAPMNTERTLNIESRQRAIDLLQLLEAALGNEES